MKNLKKIIFCDINTVVLLIIVIEIDIQFYLKKKSEITNPKKFHVKFW